MTKSFIPFLTVLLLTASAYSMPFHSGPQFNSGAAAGRVQTLDTSQGGGVGVWTWTCCSGRFTGIFAIVTQESDGTISGQFAGLTPDDSGTVQGRVQGNQIQFLRRGTLQGRNFEQMWTGRIEGSGGARKISGSIVDQQTRQQVGEFSANAIGNATISLGGGGGVSQTPVIAVTGGDLPLDGGFTPTGVIRMTTPPPAPANAAPQGQIASLPATGSGSYELKRIEVSRKYPQNWTADNNAYRPGTQNVPVSIDSGRVAQGPLISARLGWDFTWGNNKENRNRSMSDLVISELPPYVEPGEDASFAGNMRGEWNTSGYGNDRDHTIRLNGALGAGQYLIGGNPSGSYEGQFQAKNKATVPQPQNGIVTIKSTAAIRFGDDHVGEMEIRFIYEPSSKRPATLTANTVPPANVPLRTDSPARRPTTPPAEVPNNVPANSVPSNNTTPPALPAFSSLAFEMKLTDENGNTTLEGGEHFNIRVTIKNSGGAVANNVQVHLTGDSAIVNAAGPQKSAGNIGPGQNQVVDFTGIMPLKMDPHTAEVRVALFEGPSELPRSQVLRVGLVPASGAVTVNDVSEIIDVDYPPAAVSMPDRSTSVAVVIGISNYRESVIPKLPYAQRDADIFSKYLTNVAGIRKENIKFLSDDRAARSDIEDAIEDWLPLHVTETSQVYFYYAGHGALEPATGDTYLVPYEGSPDSPAVRMYPLKRLYERLGTLKAQNVMVFLDSCFSGGGRSIAMKGRPIVINSDTPQTPPPAMTNVTVLAAAAGNQVSSDYDRTKHGLFTYYLLKGMRGDADTTKDGWVDLGELSNYVRDNVRSTAVSELNREQTPVLTGGPDLEIKKNVKLFRMR